jgi:diguanylate cyclase
MILTTDFYDQDIDSARVYASKAIERLEEYHLAVMPQNFEVWYVYFSNVNPDLRLEIDELLKVQDKLSELECHELYEKYLNLGGRRETYERAGDHINATLQDVSGLVQNVKNTASQFSGTLKGATDKLIEHDAPQDIKNILSDINGETERMLHQNSELEKRLDQSYDMMRHMQREMDRIRREAATDGLTGLANRKSFDEQLKRVVGKSAKEGEIFSLVMTDIDHFKTFNDTYGHQTGDQVLRLVGIALVNGIKGQDMAARYGGEEFAIILPGTNANAAKIVSENLRKAVEQKEVVNRVTGENLGQITISLGVAQFYGDETPEEIIERADKALYASKNKGRNQVSVAPTPHEMRTT